MNAVRVVGRSPAAMSALALGVVLAGCSAGTRDRWLRVLFDDPPAAAALRTAGEPSPALGDSLVAASFQAPAAPLAGVAAAAPAPLYTHAPFASGDCRQCHDLGGSRSFQDGEADSGPGSGRATSSEKESAISAGDAEGSGVRAARLTAPVEVLCRRCHGEFDAEALAAGATVVHGPVAAGECLYCHDPHQSPAPSLLRAMDPADLCRQCHDPAATGDRAAHTGPASAACLECHDPHASATAGLLRERRP